VGENQTAGNPTVSPGVNGWVIDQLLNGYDVHVWDDGHDWWQSDDCDEWGNGPALDEIANAINNRGVSEVAIIGYSHGGGTVYNLSKRLYFDGQSCVWYGKIANLDDVIDNTKNYSLVFTSYIDAIRNDRWSRMLAEENRPWGSSYHVNQFQENTAYPFLGPLNGTHSIPMGNIDENRSSWKDSLDNLLNHTTIDDDERIWQTISDAFESEVQR
jgi:hypothetical protein